MNLKLNSILSLVLTMLAVSAFAAPVNLRTAANFGLLASQTVTNTGSSVINGDVGTSAGSSVTGFPSPGKVKGNLYLAPNGATAQAQLDLTTAYNAAAGAVPALDISGTDLGFYNAANPLAQGVYSFSSNAELTGNLTLNGGGDPNAQWIFQIVSTLITAPHASVTLINGATMNNVFWQVGTSATIKSNNVFVGNIMALTSITLNGGTLNGRALARNGAVTISSAETVNAGPCLIPEPSSIMALGMMLASSAVLFRRRK